MMLIRALEIGLVLLASILAPVMSQAGTTSVALSGTASSFVPTALVPGNTTLRVTYEDVEVWCASWSGSSCLQPFMNPDGASWFTPSNTGSFGSEPYLMSNLDTGGRHAFYCYYATSGNPNGSAAYSAQAVFGKRIYVQSDSFNVVLDNSTQYSKIAGTIPNQTTGVTFIVENFLSNYSQVDCDGW